MLAVRAGVVGDAQGDQLRVVPPVPAQVVALALLVDQVREGAHDRRMRGGSIRVFAQRLEDVEQLLAAPDELLQALQVISEANARAVTPGTLVDALDDAKALVEEHAQVLVVADRRLRLAP